MMLSLLLAISFICGAAASVVSHGAMLTIGNVSYYIPSQPTAELARLRRIFTKADPADDLIPVTVLDVGAFNETDVTALVSSYLEKDDVLNEEFLSGKSLQLPAQAP